MFVWRRSQLCRLQGLCWGLASARKSVCFLCVLAHLQLAIINASQKEVGIKRVVNIVNSLYTYFSCHPQKQRHLEEVSIPVLYTLSTNSCVFFNFLARRKEVVPQKEGEHQQQTRNGVRETSIPLHPTGMVTHQHSCSETWHQHQHIFFIYSLTMKS